MISEAVDSWNRDRFDYQVAYVLPWKDHLVAAIADTGIMVDCIGGSRGFDPMTAVRLRRLVKGWEPDIVHAHLPTAGVLARVVAPKGLVYTEHNVVTSYKPATRLANRATYGLNKAVIAVSQGVADSLGGYPGPEPQVIPNGVSTNPRVEPVDIRRRLGFGKDDPVFVHVGNIRPHKGHENLIAATAVLSASLPHARVVSIGSEKFPGDLDRVNESARRAGVEDQIRFVGKVDDARPFLAAADVVVNPSDAEGLPVALLEALSLRKPVVATDVGGVSSIVIDNETGLLVEPGDPTTLAEGMLKALNSDHAQTWGAAGAALVAERHSIHQMISEYEKVYERVVNV